MTDLRISKNIIIAWRNVGDRECADFELLWGFDASARSEYIEASPDEFCFLHRRDQYLSTLQLKPRLAFLSLWKSSRKTLFQVLRMLVIDLAIWGWRRSCASLALSARWKEGQERPDENSKIPWFRFVCIRDSWLLRRDCADGCLCATQACCWLLFSTNFILLFKHKARISPAPWKLSWQWIRSDSWTHRVPSGLAWARACWK